MAKKEKNTELVNKPISSWGYVGLSFLYATSVVGIIFLFIHAFKSKNVNLRNDSTRSGQAAPMGMMNRQESKSYSASYSVAPVPATMSPRTNRRCTQSCQLRWMVTLVLLAIFS